MLDSLYISATGLNATQQRIDAISNNLSNVGTPAYKKARVTFDDVLYRPLASTERPIAQSTEWSHQALGAGSAVARVDRMFTQGALQPTQRALDLAIQGHGFFEVEKPDGTIAYSRGGAFVVNDAGEMQTADGYRLIPAVRVPPDTLEVLIGEAGEVSVRVPDEDAPVVVGQIDLAVFMNVDGLAPTGRGLYEKTEASGEPYLARPGEDGAGGLRQGYLEASNVDFSEELVELLVAQRAFQLSARALQASDEMLGEINSLRR